MSAMRWTIRHEMLAASPIMVLRPSTGFGTNAADPCVVQRTTTPATQDLPG
jgi:hypothetical protein